MYYRLLAFKFLPEELDRILYLDPDILVINPIDELLFVRWLNAYDIKEYYKTLKTYYAGSGYYKFFVF